MQGWRSGERSPLTNVARVRFPSLRRWRDFACECFCFGSEVVKSSGEAARGLVNRICEHVHWTDAILAAGTLILLLSIA